MFRKLGLPCAPARERKAVDEFVQCERDLKVFDESCKGDKLDKYLSISSILWGSSLKELSLEDILPKHGPGSTSERIQGNQKYNWKTWHYRLERLLPFYGTAVPLGACRVDEASKVSFPDRRQEQPVRVVLVPKTLKSPRVIAMEPVCMQYAQQALMHVLVNQLEQAKMTAGHVNFTDQSINQSLAITASKSGQFSTIDLSSASDRVPVTLALRMFDSVPLMKRAVSACRSMHAKLPNGDVLSLRKFASMGSALCFPVESMYFYTICVKALLDYHRVPVTYRNVMKMSRLVYVYGDDIVVPTYAAEVVAATLQEYNCKVNTRKSFWTGKFRESCGTDAYDGEEVTPTYIRSLLPSNKRNSVAIMSTVSTANQFYKNGFWRTATFLRRKVERHTGVLPYVKDTSSGLGWLSYLGYESMSKWCANWHAPLVRTLVTRTIASSDAINGYQALGKSLLRLERSNCAPIDEDHLSMSVRRGAVTLKSQWVLPH
jgi:hypothetical protein